MVQKYSMKTQSNLQLSKNFKVSEFACKDGSDTVLIDDNLVYVLQQISNHFNAPVKITSSYRTPSHNQKVGGSSSSYHVKGMAADIKVIGVSAVEVGLFAQNICNGVGVYYYGDTEFVHVDTRQNKVYWLCAKSGKYEYYYSKLMPTIKKGISSQYSSAVKFIQKKLGLLIDGSFGAKTQDAVKEFQSKNKLVSDGIVGMNTWKKLFCKEE